MNNILILDVETTTSNTGNPFDQTNKCVMVGTKRATEKVPLCWEYWNSRAVKQGIQDELNHARLIVGFNIKFDLHWLRKIGIDISNVRVWDCQLAEFILNNQRTPYPSLDQAAEKYGLPKKLDVVKTEYWDKGIDTDKIPKNILSDYLAQDLILTQQVFEKQFEIFKTDSRYALFKLQCLDLLVLEEMEYNGIKFETEAALKKAVEIEKELDEIKQQLVALVGNAPINFNSNDHLSAIIYGGTILEDIRIPIGVFKSGAKEGQVRYKILTKEYAFPRLTEPIKRTETAKSKKRTAETGVPASLWEVNEPVLRKLKLNKESKNLISLLSRLSELEKLKGTYLIGYTELIKKMNWEKDMLHGNLNQCVAVTGRLASSKPNLQNVDPTTKLYMTSRYQ